MPGQEPNVGLREACFDKWEPGTSFGGGLLAGAMIAEIVEVDTESDDPTVGQWLQLIHECRFAPEAAVAVIGQVAGIVQLVGVGRPPIESEPGGQFPAVVDFT
jgi:hypothetical protein